MFSSMDVITILGEGFSKLAQRGNNYVQNEIACFYRVDHIFHQPS
jgi:hypothetical protein